MQLSYKVTIDSHPNSGLVLAENSYLNQMPQHVVFINEVDVSYTC